MQNIQNENKINIIKVSKTIVQQLRPKIKQSLNQSIGIEGKKLRRTTIDHQQIINNQICGLQYPHLTYQSTQESL